MKVSSYVTLNDIAIVYIASFDNNKSIEFVESVQPPIPLRKKWVLIVSTLFGCPIKCPICDAGSFYGGKLTKEQILEQIDFLVTQRFPDRAIPVEKFKVQFARMGEPAFNLHVIDALADLPRLYTAPGLMPCISTIAPYGAERFFYKLLDIKKSLYAGRFQLQFSIHSTDSMQRDHLIPARKWGFSQIAEYGRKFFETGDRKISLNFALAEGSELDALKLARYFDPGIFLIKITPINPTYAARRNKIESAIANGFAESSFKSIEALRNNGYEVLVSIGELAENDIGSNCGQYVTTHIRENKKLAGGYTCRREKFAE